MATAEENGVVWNSHENIDKIASYLVPYLGAVSQYEYKHDENDRRVYTKLGHAKALRPEWFKKYYPFDAAENCLNRDNVSGPNINFGYHTAPLAFQNHNIMEYHSADLCRRRYPYTSDYRIECLVFSEIGDSSVSNHRHDDSFKFLYRNYDIPFDAPNDGYDTIFWYLFLAAVNENIYKDRFDEIIERAAITYRFSEDMIRDWCRAVHYVLAGNILSETCDLELDSDEGKEFFLHKKPEGSE